MCYSICPQFKVAKDSGVIRVLLFIVLLSIGLGEIDWLIGNNYRLGRLREMLFVREITRVSAKFQKK
jgi:hypothetical protein